MPKELFATAFFAHSTDIVARMADVLHRVDEAKRYHDLFEQIKEAFNRRFVQPDGRLEADTQAGYALALSFDLLPATRREPAALCWRRRSRARAALAARTNSLTFMITMKNSGSGL